MADDNLPPDPLNVGEVVSASESAHRSSLENTRFQSVHPPLPHAQRPAEPEPTASPAPVEGPRPPQTLAQRPPPGGSGPHAPQPRHPMTETWYDDRSYFASRRNAALLSTVAAIESGTTNPPFAPTVPVPPEPSASTTPSTVELTARVTMQSKASLGLPDQSPAPVRVEERNGTIARLSDRDSPLSASERDFNGWREPVRDHVQELLSGDFRHGTNHSRARDRLIALSELLQGSIVEIKERQFRIGYESERLEGLISAYRSAADDMPVLNAAVLEDLDRLCIALKMGIDKLERWAEFSRAAAHDPMQEGTANPTVISDALDNMAAEMERQPNYFDPEVPESLRFMAEAGRDPWGATKTVVYGMVRSAENVFSFLGQRAVNIPRQSRGL